MKHTFYIIAKVFDCRPNGRIARNYSGKAITEYLTTPIEAETLREAELLAKDIIDDIGYDWLKTKICSEAERMWDSGYPAFFDLKALEGTRRLKGVAQ